MEQKVFWKMFNSQYAHKKRFLDSRGYFYCKLDKLKAVASLEPVNTPIDEEDFAGPVER